LLSAAVVIAGFAFSAPVLGQSAGSTLSIGVSAGGVISDIFVHAGSRVHAGDALVKLNCQPLEADLRSRQAQLHAAQATFDKVKNGPRPDEIKVGEAIVGYSQARAEEAQKTLDRTQELQEGVTVTTARVLEVKRDSRIADAQLEEAKARLSLLQAGSREEDIRQSEALRDAAAAELDSTRARLDLCTVHAPVDGVVTDIPVNVGQYVSVAVPQVLLHMTQDPTH
jgi:HlyD family secretion protein